MISEQVYQIYQQQYKEVLTKGYLCFRCRKVVSENCFSVVYWNNRRTAWNDSKDYTLTFCYDCWENMAGPMLNIPERIKK